MIPHKENIHTEFKSSFNSTVVETLVAFANSKGGIVYVGVNDAGQVKGVELATESIQQWINEIKSKTEPSLIPNVELLEVENKKVVAFSVHEHPIKPISIHGRCYKRVNNSNQLLSVSEISDLYMQSMQYSWDAYPYNGADINSLNFNKVEQFISKVNSVKRFSLPNNPMDALEKLKMIQKGIPTNAAMILFSKENLFYNVHIGRFKTPSTIIADKMISGNLYDVLEESMQTIIGHLKFAFEITGKTTQHTEIPEYPLDAIREALINALIHRNYQSPTDIQIKIFDQSVNFFNPSGLYGDITEEELKTDSYSASTRNKQIAEAFYLTNDIEKYGSGFIRIRKAISDYPTMKFEFRNTGYGFFSEFSYTKQRINSQPATVEETVEETVEKTVEKIKELIQFNSKITQKEIATKTGLTTRGIEWNLKLMKQKGIIRRIGPTKGGYWEIVNSQ